MLLACGHVIPSDSQNKKINKARSLSATGLRVHRTTKPWKGCVCVMCLSNLHKKRRKRGGVGEAKNAKKGAERGGAGGSTPFSPILSRIRLLHRLQ